jgi:phosphopentomutase
VTAFQPPFRRAIVIVMDSVGIGELPDASAYGDQGSNTVGNIAKRIPLSVPTLRSLGLDRLVQIDVPEETAETAKTAEKQLF